VPAAGQLFRWLAAAVIGLNAIDQMSFIPAYPFWSLTIIALGVIARYGAVRLRQPRDITAI